MSELPAPAPPVNIETEPFWAATTEGRLLLLRCDDCSAVIWYPRSICPNCRSSATSWIEASGRGTIYSYTVVRRGQGRWREAAPYVVAYVELEEGPRLLTNVVDCDPDGVGIDMAVRVRFDPTGEGPCLPRFVPDPSAH